MKKRKKVIDYSISDNGGITKIKNISKDGKIVKSVSKYYDPNTKGRNVERSRVIGDKAISFGRRNTKSDSGERLKATTLSVLSPEKSKMIAIKNEGGKKSLFTTKRNTGNKTSLTMEKSRGSKPLYSVKGVSDKTSVKNTDNRKYAKELYRANKGLKKSSKS